MLFVPPEVGLHIRVYEPKNTKYLKQHAVNLPKES